MAWAHVEVAMGRHMIAITNTGGILDPDGRLRAYLCLRMLSIHARFVHDYAVLELTLEVVYLSLT